MKEFLKREAAANEAIDALHVELQQKQTQLEKVQLQLLQAQEKTKPKPNRDVGMQAENDDVLYGSISNM